MVKDIINNLKTIINKKTEGNNKKNIENLVVFLILLVITIIAINVIWGNKSPETKEYENVSEYKKLAENLDNSSHITEEDEYNLEEKLEDILSKINGVGKVKVLITYSETNEVVAMYNEKSTSSNTQETDTSGGTRKIEQIDSNKEIIYEEKNGEKAPITQKIVMPKIEGAIVTAEGAKNANIKTNIVQAVSAVTGLPVYRIQVFEMST